MERKRTVVVERSKWLRSPDYRGPEYVAVMHEKKPGLSAVEIVQEQLSASADERLADAQARPQAEFQEQRTDRPESLVQAAEDINDRRCESGNWHYLFMTEAEQEDRLARLFATVGIELTFIN